MIYVVKDIFYLIFSGFLTWFFLKLSINFLKKHLVDFPNNRSSHKSPKPTSGGISFLFSISIISFFKGIYVPLFAIPLAFIGFIDDKWGVKPWIRLTAQIITVIVYFYIFLLDIIKLNIDIQIIFLILSFPNFCGMAIINFINFMDGIDGLVSS